MTSHAANQENKKHVIHLYIYIPGPCRVVYSRSLPRNNTEWYCSQPSFPCPRLAAGPKLYSRIESLICQHDGPNRRYQRQNKDSDKSHPEVEELLWIAQFGEEPLPCETRLVEDFFLKLEYAFLEMLELIKPPNSF